MPAVRTVVVSDLHLGVRAGNDVARRPAIRDVLARTVEGADRLVLLGDVLELRERSLADILALSRPLWRDLGDALGDGEVILVPGNHDHALVAPVAAAHGGISGLRGLEQRLVPPPSGPLGELARAVAPARLELAYPGVWLDERTYAMHGHHMDVHSPIPMVECLALAVSARLHGGPPGPGATPADYERIATPVYRLSRRIGRAGQTLGRAGRGDVSIRLYERLAGQGSDHRAPSGGAPPGDLTPAAGSSPTGASTAAAPAGRAPARSATLDLGDRLLARAVPAAVAGLNRLGLGPFQPDLSGRALRRAGLLAMAEVIDRLAIEADHVVFGHTHRAGPLPGDVEGWELPGRAGGRPPTRLLNTGSWVYTPAFVGRSPERSPYWPGRCAIVEDGRPPELVHPLADEDRDELARLPSGG